MPDYSLLDAFYLVAALLLWRGGYVHGRYIKKHKWEEELPKPKEPVDTKFVCVCGHRKTSHSGRGTGECNTYLGRENAKGRELGCACQVYIPAP